MIGRVDVVKVGEKERGFVCSELCQKSLGPSGQFFFSLVNVRWWSVDDAVVWDGEEMLLNCLCVYGFVGFCLVCLLFWVLMGGMEQDEIVGVVKNGFLHLSWWWGIL